MPKTLVIMRHAKSTWEYGPISDMDRPLKEVGILNTQLIAQKLKEKKYIPDIILTSPANRALHTSLIVARELHYPVQKIRIEPEIYNDAEDEILALLKSVDNAYNSLFIFGHNPTFTILANKFLKEMIPNLPTSGATIFTFQIEKWADITKGAIISEDCFFPKSLE